MSMSRKSSRYAVSQFGDDDCQDHEPGPQCNEVCQPGLTDETAQYGRGRAAKTHARINQLATQSVVVLPDGCVANCPHHSRAKLSARGEKMVTWFVVPFLALAGIGAGAIALGLIGMAAYACWTWA